MSRDDRGGRYACARLRNRGVAVSLYEWLVSFHVLGACVWIGGAVVTQALAIRATRSDDPTAVGKLAGDVEWVGTRVIIPSTIVLLIAGIWAVVEGPWEFEQGWITAGLVVWILSFITGAGFLGPESGRIKNLIAASGPEAPEVRRRVGRILFIARIELVLLIAIVFIMVGKPWL